MHENLIFLILFLFKTQGICDQINSNYPLERDYERTFYPTSVFNSDPYYYWNNEFNFINSNQNESESQINLNMNKKRQSLLVINIIFFIFFLLLLQLFNFSY
jgi:hypothetical protein